MQLSTAQGSAASWRMPTLVRKRPMTVQERESLETLLNAAPTSFGRFRRAAWNALVLCCLAIGVFLVSWTGIAWVLRRTVRVEIGNDSTAGIWIASAGILGCAAYSIGSTAHWMKR